MADIIKMLLKANIDVKESVGEINEQIKEISKQVDTIKIKVDIDKEVFDNIKNINEKINTMAGKTVKPIKIETPDIERAKNQFRELNEEIGKMTGFDPSKTPIHKGMEIISWSIKDAGDGTKKFTQTLNDGKNNIITYNGVLNNTSNQYEILGKTVRQSTRENQTFLKELDIAIRRSITWMLGMTAVYGSLRKVREGITFIKELDKELTQVSIITQKTREETYQLAQEYAKLGKQLGKTVKEISSVNTELIRQGLSLEESQQRLLTIMRLNAVSDVDMNPQETLKVITSSVNALKTEAEHAGNVILKASQISASSVSEIGNALTKTASSAQVTGMTIEQLVGIISTLEEVTQESASSLGTSVKTLLARFNKINEETGEINKELNDVQKAFESVGVAFLDGEKQIRPVYDLLSDLNPIWKELDKNTKHYIATMAAGVRQQNRFFAIMENFDRVKEIQNELVDSTGTLDDAFAKYQESAEYAAKRTALAFEQMWLNAINSESIKEFYNLLTAIIELIDKFGALETAIFGVSFVLLSTQNRLKRFLSLLPDVSWYFSTAIAEMGLFKGSLFALGAVMDATRIRATLMWTAITLGASYLVTVAIGQVNKLINSYLDLKRSNEELVQSYENAVKANSSNIERLSKLSSEYDKIKNKIENQIDLNEEEKRTLDEIININPSLIKGYDERGQAIIDTTQNLEDMIDTLKRANEIEEIRLVSGGQGLFKQARRDIKNTQNDISELIKQIDEIQYGKTITSQLTGREVRRESTGLVYLREQYDKVIESQGKYSEEARKLATEIQKKETQLKNLNSQLSIHEQSLKTNSTEVKNSLFAHTRLSDAYKDLSSEMKSFIGEYIKLMDITDFDSFIDMQVAVDMLTDSLKNADISNIVNEYKNLKQEFDTNKISAKEFDIEVKDVVKTLSEMLNIPEDVLSKFFKDSSEINKSLKTTNRELELFEQSIDSIILTLEEYEGKNKVVNDAIKEFNETGNISVSTLKKLIETFPELIEQTDLSSTSIVNFLNNYKTTSKGFIQGQINMTESAIENARLRIEAYQEEIRELLRLITTIDGISNSSVLSSARLESDVIKKRQRVGVESKYIEDLKQKLNILKNTYTHGFETKSGTSGKSSSPYESQIDSLREYQIAIQVLESEIKRYQSYAELTTSEQNRIEYLNKINDLTKQQQDKLHELNNELRKQRDGLGEWLQKQGMGTFDKLTGSFDRTTEGIAKYNKMSDKMKEKIDEAVKGLDGLNSQIDTNSLKWLELQTTIKSREFGIFNANIEYLEGAIKSLNNELDISKSKMQRYEESSAEYNIEQAKQIELIKEKQQRIREIIDLLQYQIATSDLTTEQLKTMIDSLQSWQKALWDTETALNSIQKNLENQLDKLATEVINAYKDYYQKRKTIALKSIDDEIKAEEKRHKRVIERLDSELKAYEEIIQAKLKLIDETQDEEEYEKQLTQAQQERQEIQNLINELSMDDSIEARTRVHELNKDLAKKDEQIEKLQNDRSIKLRKKNLNDQLDIYRKEVQAKKDAENQKYERTKERLALEKDEITRYYDNLINDERKYAKIREDILDGHLDKVSKNFDEFTKDLDKNSEIIGESLTENLIDKMAKVRRDLERTLDELNSVKTSSSSRDKSSNSEDKLNLKPGEEKYIGGTKYYKGVDGKNYKSNDGGWTWEEYHDGGIIGGKTDKTTKIVNELFNVQPNEMAIKALKGELMIPPQNIVNNFIPNMKGLINSMPSGGSNINIKEFLKIDNFINNTDTDIDTLVDRATNRFVDRLKPLGLFVKKI